MILSNGLAPIQWEVEVEIDGRFVHWSSFAHMRSAIECANQFAGRRNARVLKIVDGERPL